jgi:hypothetical protein
LTLKLVYKQLRFCYSGLVISKSIKKTHDWGSEWRNEEGKLHREDGPAVEQIIGNKFWYNNGKFHREDGPAIEWWDAPGDWYLRNTRIIFY